MNKQTKIIIWLVLLALYVAAGLLSLPLLRLLTLIPLLYWSLRSAIKDEFLFQNGTTKKVLLWLVVAGLWFILGGIIGLIAGIILAIYSLKGAIRR